MTRRKIPNRRPSMNRKVERPVSFADPMAGESTFFLTIGFDPKSLSPVEVFYAEGFRTGSDLEFLMIDACIVISLALQHGIPAKAMNGSLSKRRLPNGEEVDASLLALILRAVIDVEGEIRLLPD